MAPFLQPWSSRARATGWCLLLSLLWVVPGARAGHYAGGSITWECIGAGQYEVHLDLFLDCSGFTTIILQSQDVMGEQERLSAQSQYNRWKANAVTLANVDLGDLVFYGSSTGNITHVMLVLNKTLCIGAQGGGEATKTIGDAVATDGYVRTRKIDYRSDRVAIVRPPWPFHG